MRPPEYVEWTHDGKTFKQVSPAWKRELLFDYAKRFNLRTFVETGTCGGDTIAALYDHFDKLYSIEVHGYVYSLGSERFKGDPKVTMIYGDSAVELPRLLYRITEPALYWLDAHLDGPANGYGLANPLMTEISAIMSQKKEGIILVDDLDFARPAEWHNGVLRITL